MIAREQVVPDMVLPFPRQRPRKPEMVIGGAPPWRWPTHRPVSGLAPEPHRLPMEIHSGGVMRPAALTVAGAAQVIHGRSLHVGPGPLFPVEPEPRERDAGTDEAAIG